MFLCDFRFQLKSWRSLRRSTKPSERASCSKRTPSTDTRYGTKRCVRFWVKAHKPEGKCLIRLEDAAIKRHVCVHFCRENVTCSKIRLSARSSPPAWILRSSFCGFKCDFDQSTRLIAGSGVCFEGKNSSRLAVKMFFIILPENCVCRWIYWNCIKETLSAVTHPDGNWLKQKTKTKKKQEGTWGQGRTSQLIF